MDLFEAQLSELCEVFSTQPRDKIKRLLELHKDSTDAVNIVTELLLNEQEEQEEFVGPQGSDSTFSDWLDDEDDEDDEQIQFSSNKKRKAIWDDDTQVTKKIDKSGEVVFVYSETYKDASSQQHRGFKEDEDEDDDEDFDFGNLNYQVPSYRWPDPHHNKAMPELTPLGSNSTAEDCFTRLKELFPDHEDDVLRWCISESESELRGIGTATRTRKIKVNLFERATNLVLQQAESSGLPNQVDSSEAGRTQDQQKKMIGLAGNNNGGDEDDEEEDEDEDFDPDQESDGDAERKDEEDELEQQSDSEEEEEDNDDDDEEGSDLSATEEEEANRLIEVTLTQLIDSKKQPRSKEASDLTAIGTTTFSSSTAFARETSEGTNKEKGNQERENTTEREEEEKNAII